MEQALGPSPLDRARIGTEQAQADWYRARALTERGEGMTPEQEAAARAFLETRGMDPAMTGLGVQGVLRAGELEERVARYDAQNRLRKEMEAAEQEFKARMAESKSRTDWAEAMASFQARVAELKAFGMDIDYPVSDIDAYFAPVYEMLQRQGQGQGGENWEQKARSLPGMDDAGIEALRKMPPQERDQVLSEYEASLGGG